MGYFIKNYGVGQTPIGTRIAGGSENTKPLPNPGPSDGSIAGGILRYNKDSRIIEYYDGNVWLEIITSKALTDFPSRVETYLGTGVLLQFPFGPGITVTDEDYIIVFIDGVYVNPNSYSLVAFTELLFTVAPALNSEITFIFPGKN